MKKAKRWRGRQAAGLPVSCSMRSTTWTASSTSITWTPRPSSTSTGRSSWNDCSVPQGPELQTVLWTMEMWRRSGTQPPDWWRNFVLCFMKKMKPEWILSFVVSDQSLNSLQSCDQGYVTTLTRTRIRDMSWTWVNTTFQVYVHSRQRQKTPNTDHRGQPLCLLIKSYNFSIRFGVSGDVYKL